MFHVKHSSFLNKKTEKREAQSELRSKEKMKNGSLKQKGKESNKEIMKKAEKSSNTMLHVNINI